MTIEQPLTDASTAGGQSRSTDVLERRLLCVRPHRHRELLNLPEELEVGWMVSGHFWGFAACKDSAAFDALCADLRSKHGDFDISDMRSNVEVTGLAAASLPQGPCGLPGSTPATNEERSPEQ